MTISEQLIKLRDALADWARENSGSVVVASDPVHLWNLLSTKPGAPRGILLFDSEEKRGDIEEAGRVDRKFLLVISRGRGFTADRADALTKGSAGGKPLFDLVEEAREIVRSIEVESPEEIDEVVTNHLRTARFDSGDLIVDAYQIEFSLATQLPEYHE